MFTTQNQEDFDKELSQFIKDNGDQYSLGFFQSMLVSMLADLPKRKQKEEISFIKRRNDQTLVKVKNLLTGNEVEIPRGSVGSVCDPSTERYHTM